MSCGVVGEISMIKKYFKGGKLAGLLHYDAVKFNLRRHYSVAVWSGKRFLTGS